MLWLWFGAVVHCIMVRVSAVAVVGLVKRGYGVEVDFAHVALVVLVSLRLASNTVYFY